MLNERTPEWTNDWPCGPSEPKAHRSGSPLIRLVSWSHFSTGRRIWSGAVLVWSGRMATRVCHQHVPVSHHGHPEKLLQSCRFTRLGHTGERHGEMCAECEESHMGRDRSSRWLRGSRVSGPGGGQVTKGSWRGTPLQSAV